VPIYQWLIDPAMACSIQVGTGWTLYIHDQVQPMDSQLASSNVGGDLRPASSSAEPMAEDPGPVKSPTATGPTILVVEDDVPLSKFLKRGLKLEHFSVHVSHDGETGWADLQQAGYDLLILDLNLPKMDGIAVLKQVRLTQPRLPVLVLTARNRIEDMVLALEQGADDCLIKPFPFLELLARIRALLRRNSGAAAVSSSRLGDLSINRDEHKVQRGDRRIDLTPREFAILEYLMRNAGKPVSRMMLMRDVWNIPFDPTTNIVDVYMKYLRDKIDLEGEAKLIRTVRGVGYALTND
jgi:DNA-binding response OmpR family regulator